MGDNSSGFDLSFRLARLALRSGEKNAYLNSFSTVSLMPKGIDVSMRKSPPDVPYPADQIIAED